MSNANDDKIIRRIINSIGAVGVSHAFLDAIHDSSLTFLVALENLLGFLSDLKNSQLANQRKEMTFISCH